MDGPTLELLSQVAILVLGGLSIAAISLGPKYEFKGYLVGVISEPFWLYTAYTHEQWGICISAIWWLVFYTVGLARTYGKKQVGFNK